MAEEVERLLLKDFAAQVNDVVDKMKTAFHAAETGATNMDQWAKGRRDFEEKVDGCNCVSEVMEDMAEMLHVSTHLLQTYGTMLLNAAEKIAEHKDPKDMPAVKRKVEEALNNLPEDIKNHLVGLDDDEAKMN